MKTVLTHGGQFHADEVLAIALLKCAYGELSITRGFKVPEDHEFDYVLDIGGVYDPMEGLYDHHQSEELEATNVLVLTQVMEMGDIAGWEYNHLLPFFMEVSDKDTGMVGVKMGDFNWMIRQFNSLPEGFDRAVDYAFNLIEAMLFTADVKHDGEVMWTMCGFEENYAIHNGPQPIVDWQKLAERDGIEFLITKNDRTEGHWNCVSRDSRHFQVPSDGEGQVFRHASGFMGVYDSLENAIYAALNHENAII
jgi:hypothetical protein